MPGVRRRPGARGASLTDRLASAHGHLGAIRRMAAEGEPCPQVVYQLRAVRNALAQAERLLVRQHLRHCLAAAGLDAASLQEIADLWDYTPTARGARATPSDGGRAP
ncbi:MAG: metal-sensitive transcriptional regulator [Trueperaceae bacterium]